MTTDNLNTTTWFANYPSFVVGTDDVSATVMAQRWTKWLGRFRNMLEAMSVTEDKKKKAMLLHYGGEAIYDIYQTLTIAHDSFEATVNALTAYFQPQKNLIYQTFLFRQMKQESSESTDQFNTRLQAQAALCEFLDKEKEIKVQILIGTKHPRLRRRGLQEQQWALKDILEAGRNYELAETHASEIERGKTENPEVNRFHKTAWQNKNRAPRSQKTGERCSYCGRVHERGKQKCPALSCFW